MNILQIAGDRDLADRIGDLPVLDPEALGPGCNRR